MGRVKGKANSNELQYPILAGERLNRGYSNRSSHPQFEWAKCELVYKMTGNKSGKRREAPAILKFGHEVMLVENLLG